MTDSFYELLGLEQGLRGRRTITGPSQQIDVDGPAAGLEELPTNLGVCLQQVDEFLDRPRRKRGDRLQLDQLPLALGRDLQLVRRQLSARCTSPLR